MANLYLTRGDRINLRTRTLTHNRTLRPVSLSVQEFFFFSFFVFFSLFWDSLLLLLGRGRTFFHCVVFFFLFSFFFKWEQRGRGLIVRECWGGRGCLVRGIPRCCSPSAPGKEREKEGEFFSGWLKKTDTNFLV